MSKGLRPYVGAHPMTAPSICAAPGCIHVRPCPIHAVPSGRSRGWQWSTQIVPAVLARDHHTCVMCGRPCPHPKHHHVDHRTPRQQGGTDDMSNLRTVCQSFNLSGVCR